jgi:hypothetical protein
MNVSALAPAYDLSRTTSGNNAGSASTGGNPAPFLTTEDAATLERIDGFSSISVLESNAGGLSQAEWVSRDRHDGDITGSLSQYMPAASLRNSDTSFMESLPGTQTASEAVSANPDADSLAMNIYVGRNDGTLTGDITTGFLNTMLSAPQQSASVGSLFRAVRMTVRHPLSQL